MQNKKAEQLRKEWGDTPCDHPSFDKEYFNGSDSGDYICTQCGQVFARFQKEKIESDRYDKK